MIENFRPKKKFIYNISEEQKLKIQSAVDNINKINIKEGLEEAVYMAVDFFPQIQSFTADRKNYKIRHESLERLQLSIQELRSFTEDQLVSSSTPPSKDRVTPYLHEQDSLRLFRGLAKRLKQKTLAGQSSHIRPKDFAETLGHSLSTLDHSIKGLIKQLEEQDSPKRGNQGDQLLDGIVIEVVIAYSKHCSTPPQIPSEASIDAHHPGDAPFTNSSFMSLLCVALETCGYSIISNTDSKKTTSEQFTKTDIQIMRSARKAVKEIDWPQ